MRRTTLFCLTAIAAVIFTACGPAANTGNNTATTNTNTKPAGTAPTADQLLALDKQANEAYMKGDAKPFEAMLSDRFVMYDSNGRMDKAGVLKMVADTKCDVKEGWKLDEPQVAAIDNDTYVLTYKGTFDGSCTMAGKKMPLPSPVRAASIWVRSGSDWKAVFHGENPIMDPSAAPADKKPDTKKEEAKKTEPPKKEEPKKDDKDAGTKPAAAQPDPNTDALTKIHLSGWEAWKAKDTKKFEEITSSNLSFVDPGGKVTTGKANVIKAWADMKCEGVTKVGVTNGFASALSPTVEILTNKGTSDGTCDGQKNGDLYGTAVYVKEGDAWKLAFLFESLPAPAM